MVRLSLNAITSRSHLTADNGVQMLYVLLEPQVFSDAPRHTPIHYCMIVDCSPSMRIPIADDALFRELMRQGDAQEVMVDGLPAWKINRRVAHDIRQRTTSPSQWLAQAVGGASERMHPNDRLSVIGFASNAHTVLRHAAPSETRQITAAVSHVEHGDFGNSTVLAPALQKAIDVLQTHRNPERSEHVLLVTDGFVEDADASRLIAQAFAEAAIPCSTIGLGVEFQEQLLMEFADQSGGQATFINNAQAIPAMMQREFAHGERIAVQRARLEIRVANGVQVRHVYRVRPVIAEIAPTSDPLQTSIALGNLDHDANDALLLELVVPARPAHQFRLARFSLHGVAPQGTLLEAAHHELVMEYQPHAEVAINPQVLPIIERVTAWRVQTRALDAAADGDAAGATRQLQAAVTRLINLGADDLAQQTAAITQQISTTGAIDPIQIKELRYATRKLGE